MPTTTAPASGNYIQSGGQYYTQAEWQAKNAGVPGAAQASTAIDGRQIVADKLAQYNLPGLSLDDAWNAYVQSGNNIDYWANTWLPTTAAFQAVYPAYSKLAAMGDGITVAQYQAINKQWQQFGQQYGIPAGFITPDRIAQGLIAGQSMSEVQAGLNRAAQTLADPDVQAWMNAHPSDGGLGGHQLTPGEIYAQLTDPAVSEQAAQDRFTQAQIGGAALRQGQDIGLGTAQSLQQSGVTQAQAQSGFGQIAQQSQLYGALPGNAGEKNISEDQAVGAQFGTSASDALAVQQRAAQRKATFAAGGSLATGNGGYQGAGTASGA